MEIVVNEWLLDYLRPDASKEEKHSAIKFINAWVERCDKVVIRRPGPFVSKFYQFMGQFGWDSDSRNHFRKLFNLLFVNADKTIILDDCDVEELPEGLIEKIPPDDKYLVELCYSRQNSVIVTTDAPLRNKLIEHDSSAKIYLLKEFLPTYIPHK